jgi:hypothetical protein
MSTTSSGFFFGPITETATRGRATVLVAALTEKRRVP